MHCPIQGVEQELVQLAKMAALMPWMTVANQTGASRCYWMMMLHQILALSAVMWPVLVARTMPTKNPSLGATVATKEMLCEGVSHCATSLLVLSELTCSAESRSEIYIPM
jgi:hypothetical protein